MLTEKDMDNVHFHLERMRTALTLIAREVLFEVEGFMASREYAKERINTALHHGRILQNILENDALQSEHTNQQPLGGYNA